MKGYGSRSESPQVLLGNQMLSPSLVIKEQTLALVHQNNEDLEQGSTLKPFKTFSGIYGLVPCLLFRRKTTFVC